MDDLIQRLRAEPTASQFMRIGDLVESLVAERKEAADRIAACLAGWQARRNEALRRATNPARRAGARGVGAVRRHFYRVKRYARRSAES